MYLEVAACAKQDRERAALLTPLLHNDAGAADDLLRLALLVHLGQTGPLAQL